MNKCTRGATSDMSKTKRPQSTLQIQVESVGDVVDGMVVSAVNRRHWCGGMRWIKIGFMLC